MRRWSPINSIRGKIMVSFQELKDRLTNSFIPAEADGIEALIQINIEGLTNFYISIKNNSIEVEEGEDENPGLTLSFDSFETLEKVFSGDQSAAMQAFMQGKVKFSGDMTLGQKLGSVFKAPE